MKETDKLEVMVREEGDGKGGTKKFRFLWHEPNPKYMKEDPFTKKLNLNRMVPRQETRAFVGWVSANEYAELKERHLAKVYANHQWPETKTNSVPC